MNTFKLRNILGVLLSCLLTSILFIPSVLAAGGSALEEVIVTARKREESLQDTPLAVSAFTGAALLESGVSNLADITELVPNLQISRPARDANIYIRGVGPTRGATNVTELSVGVYLDQVFLLKPQGQLLDLAAIESVQVLRGPQGTLFGKNTTGGALLVTTVKPSDESGGFGQVTVGNLSQLSVRGSVDIPISDSLMSKLTVTSVQADGGWNDPGDGTDLNNDDRQGVFGQLLWLPSDDVTVDFGLFHNRIRENLLANGNCVVTNPEAVVQAEGLITPVSGFKGIADYCEEASDSVSPYYPPQRKFTVDASLASINVAWEINENTSLRSITAWVYQETPSFVVTNSFVGQPSGQASLEDGDSTQTSQEFQLNGDLLDDSLHYTAGFYYMNDETDTGNLANWNGVNGVCGAIGQTPPGQVAALSNYSESGQTNKNDSYSVYTQWSWDFTEQLELTAGLRYGYEERDVKTRRQDSLPPWEAYANVPGTLIIPGLAALMPNDVFFNSALDVLPLPLDEMENLQANKNFDSLTPMASVGYNLPDTMLSDNINGLLLYVSYTKGYKAGGFSDFSTGELFPFDEEEIYSTEVGAKLDAWDNRLRVNAALFSMDYSNMQLFVARPDPDPNAIGSFQGVVNAGESEIKGAELEVTALPTENWRINFSASYADGVFKEFQDFTFEDGEVVGVDRSDEDLPSLPELTFNLGVQYDWDTSFGRWTARADAYYRDELYWGFDALSWSIPLARESATTESFTVFNARLSWQVSDELMITAWGKNLANKTYYDGGVGEAQNLGIANKSFAPPRLYGIDVRYAF